VGANRKGLLWLAAALGAIFVVGTIGILATPRQPAAGRQAAGVTPTSRAAVTPSATPTAAPTRAPAQARDGSCAPQPCANDNYGWIVNVNRVQYDAPGGSYSQPEAGNVFVLVDVTFTNKLAGEQHANPTQFVLLDGAGIKHTWRPFLDGPCATWEPVNVTRGASFGPKCLSFEAAAGKPAGLVLVWTPSFGGYNLKLS
jgi:hypothetical protein